MLLWVWPLPVVLAGDDLGGLASTVDETPLRIDTLTQPCMDAGLLLLAGLVLLYRLCRRMRDMPYVELTPPATANADQPPLAGKPTARGRRLPPPSFKASSTSRGAARPDSVSSTSSRIPLDPHAGPDSVASSSQLTFFSQVGCHTTPVCFLMMMGCDRRSPHWSRLFCIADVSQTSGGRAEATSPKRQSAGMPLSLSREREGNLRIMSTS